MRLFDDHMSSIMTLLTCTVSTILQLIYELLDYVTARDV